MIKLRKCTTCFAELPMDQFYSKGDRLDSSCRSCIKKKHRTKYAAKKNQFSKADVDRLKQVVDILAEHEMKRLDGLIKKLDKVISRVHPSSSLKSVVWKGT